MKNMRRLYPFFTSTDFLMDTLQQEALSTQKIHHTTSLSLYGQYEKAEEGPELAALPRHGYSKDQRSRSEANAHHLGHHGAR